MDRTKRDLLAAVQTKPTKAIFSLRRRSFAAAALVVCMLPQAIGCGSGDAPTGESTRAIAASLSGEDIFRGLFFGQGAAAKLLPEYWSEDAVRSAARQYLRDPNAAASIDQALASLGTNRPDSAADARAAAQEHLEKIGTGEIAPPSEATRERLASAIIGTIAKRDPMFFQRFAAGIKSGNPQTVSTTFDGAKAQMASALQEMGLVGRDGIAMNDTTHGEPNFYIEVTVAIALALILIAILIDISYIPLPPFTGDLARDTLMNTIAERFGPSTVGSSKK